MADEWKVVKEANADEWKIVKEDSSTDWARIAAQGLGGMVGGAIASPGVVTTPVGVGIGSAAAGQVYDRTMERLGAKTPEPAAKAALTAAEDFAFDVVSPIAISEGIYAGKKIATTLVNKASSSLFRPSDISKYAKFGVKPTAASITQSKGLMVAENALSDFPLSSGVMQKVAQYNVEQLKFSAEYLAKEYGDILTKEELGILVQKGSRGAMDRLDGVYKKLFSKVSEQIGSAPQKLDNTISILDTLYKEAKVGPESGIIKIGEDIFNKAATNEGGLPFDAIKKFRTKIGDMMRDPSLISTRDIQSGDLKRLYAALSADMEQAALNAGGKAHASWRAANKYFEISINKKLPILEEIVKKGYSEDAYNILMKSSAQGGSRLRLLRRQISNEEWNDVAGTLLGKLGTATSGAQNATGEMFSLSTFLTNWNKLAPEAKTAIWGGSKYQSLYRELNDLASVVGDMKSIEAIANKSKTGSVLMFYGIFQSLSGAAGMAAGGMPGAAATTAITMGAAPYYSAKLLTNPDFVRWLAQGVRISKTSPASMTTHMGRLFALRENEKIKDEIDEVIKTLK